MARRAALAGEPRTRYASAHSNGKGHFEGSTAKVETDTHWATPAAAFSTATGFLQPTGVTDGLLAVLVIEPERPWVQPLKRQQQIANPVSITSVFIIINGKCDMTLT